MTTAIRAKGLGKRYVVTAARAPYRTLREDIAGLWRRGRGGTADSEIWAVRDVSFELGAGQALGIVGRNGAGKSTLLKLLSRVTEPTAGRAELRGRVASLLEVGSGFHPELTGRENVFLNGTILGMTRSEIRRKFDTIVEFAEVASFIDMPVKRYSSGMYLRLAFAVAAHLEAEILVIDETLAVGDVAFQRKCIEQMKEAAGSGRTILFVSHNMAAVESFCTVACRLGEGRLLDWGPVPEIVTRYLSDSASTGNVALGDRRDRRGEGFVRLTGLALEGPGGETLAVAQCGQDVAIRLEYECAGELGSDSLLFAIGVNSLHGQRMFLCSNDLVGARLAGLPRRGAVRCTIPKLPLTPAVYSLSLIVRRKGVIEDWLLDAFLLTVEPGDFFGTGRLPDDTYSGFVVSHRWTAG
jgi:lipopolysaccharide transport system ATP-binding protein